MGRFVSDIALFLAVFAAISVPVIVIARRKGRPTTARRFAIGAAVSALSVAVISATSDLLIEQCREAGNAGCIDYGSSGMQFLVIAGFALVAIIRGIRLYLS